MRLWDYRLIPVLPKAMLVSQWRECIAIKRQWEKGALKHRLVSYVKNYDELLFLNYIQLVVWEMENRNIKYNEKYYKEIRDFCWAKRKNRMYIVKNDENYPEHNDRYLKQCYYNLQEKYDRGIITKEEWQKIEYLIGKEV